MSFWDTVNEAAWGTANAIKQRTRRMANPPGERTPSSLPMQNTDADTVLAYYMPADGGGRVFPIKAYGRPYSAGYSGFGGAYNSRISSSDEGYANAWVASVWANRAVDIRARALSRLDWQVVNKKTGKVAPEHEFMIALNRSRDRIVRRMEWSLLIWGEAYIWPRLNAHGYYSDLTWLNNLGMDVQTVAGYISGYLYMPIDGGSTIQFGSGQPKNHQLAFFKTDNPFSDLRGLSKFETVLMEIGIDVDISRTVRTFYANDARPGVLLMTDPNSQWQDVPKAQAFMDYWKANFRGSQNAGKPVMLPAGITDVRPMERPPSLDDVELRQSVRREIAAAFGVPLSVLGAWDDAQYQSAPEQRKSFYEETVIPEADDLADDLTTHLLSKFWQDTEHKVVADATGIMALMENQEQKIASYNSQLVSGGITLNDYRRELGKAPLANGDVLYVPTGVTQVPIKDIGKPIPQATAPQFNQFAPPQRSLDSGHGNHRTSAIATQPPAQPIVIPVRTGNTAACAVLPAPEPAPAAQPETAVESAAPEPSAVAPMPEQINADPVDELGKWEKKALNKGVTKAVDFECYTLPADVQWVVRKNLFAIGQEAKPAAIREVFGKASELLKKKVEDALSVTPEEYLEYWGEFDKLMQELGDSWLRDYMRDAWREIKPTINGTPSLNDVQQVLSSLQDDLVETWTGTLEEPGILTRIMFAGMAAGNQAIVNNKPADPDGTKATVGIQIDWEIISQQAVDFVQDYCFDLIRGLNAETQKQVQKSLDSWLQSGKPLSALSDDLETIFMNEARAALIAQTESTRAYNEGAFERYRQAGVVEAKWQTVRDNHVCPVCAPLHNKIGTLEGGWGDAGIIPPAHPGCRCFTRPIVTDNVLSSDAATSRVGYDEWREEARRNSADIVKKVEAQRKKLQNLEAQVSELNRQAEQAFTEHQRILEAMQNPDLSDEEWERLRSEKNKYFDQFQKADEQKQAARKKRERQQELARQAVLQDTGTDITRYLGQTSATPSKALESKLKDAERFVRGIYRDDIRSRGRAMTYEVNVETDPVRAFERGGSIHIDENAPPATIVHELGHVLEGKDASVRRRAVEFIERRRYDEQEHRIRDIDSLGREFADNELAYNGNFIDAYVGKIYRDRSGNINATEVISMGLENIFIDPVGFYERDPEHFELIMAVLGGIT